MAQYNTRQQQSGVSIIECLAALAVMTLMMIAINKSLLHIQYQEQHNWHQEQKISSQDKV